MVPIEERDNSTGTIERSEQNSTQSYVEDDNATMVSIDENVSSTSAMEQSEVNSTQSYVVEESSSVEEESSSFPLYLLYIGSAVIFILFVTFLG